MKRKNNSYKHLDRFKAIRKDEYIDSRKPEAACSAHVQATGVFNQLSFNQKSVSLSLTKKRLFFIIC